MDRPQNGLEFLKEIRKRNGEKAQPSRAFSDYLDTKAREKGVPLHGQFELTPFCNFDCKMCYVHLDATQLVNQKILPANVWKDLMHQALEMGMLKATLTGGECLTYQGFDELYLYLQSLGCEVSVLTNGYLLDERWIKFFKQHPPRSIKITLYGWNNDVYERVTGHRFFDIVVKNIHKALNEGLPITLSVTPSVFLGEDVFETIRFGISITERCYVNSGLFSPRKETGRSEQHADLDADFYIRIYRFLHELNGTELKKIDFDKLPYPGGKFHDCEELGLLCGGGRSSFVIDWKGTMKPCNRLDVVCAYPLSVGFREAWGKVNYEVNKWPRVPECKGCAYYGVCNDCAAKMLQYAEPGKQPVELCKQTMKFVQCGLAHISECE